MLETAKCFLAELESKNWKYREVKELENGRNLVVLSFNAKASTVDMHLIFDPDCHAVCLRVFKLFVVPIDKRLPIMEQMNAFNEKYRWVKFFISSESDASIQTDAVINAENSGKIVMELILRTLNIINETYPVFMHTIWA